MLGGGGTVGGGVGGTARGSDRPPTHRVPGTSVAAGAGTAAHGTTWADAAKRAVHGGTATPPLAAGEKGPTAAGKCSGGPTVDADGFQQVTGRFRRKPGAATSAAVGEGGTRVDDAPRHEEGGQQATEGAAAASEGDKDEGDHGAQPTAEELHQAWLDEVAFVKKLRQQGVQGTHPAMLAACEARDAAERAWRGSKEPAPAAVRLGRAQHKLDRAVALQAEARQAIMEAEKAHRETLAVLQATMDECTERVRLRRSQLREVQDEVGAGSAGAGDGQGARQQAAIRRVHDAICADIGPTLAALVEQIDTGAPAWTALNGVLGKLSASKEALESACAPRVPPQFDIGDDDQGKWESWSEWSESHDMQGRAWGGGRGRNGSGGNDGGPWTYGKGDEGTHADGDADDGMDGIQDHSTEADTYWGAPAHRWAEAPRWQPCGHGKWSRSAWADQLEHEHGDRDDGDGGDDQPAAARRRLDDGGSGSGHQGTTAPQAQLHVSHQAGAAAARGGDCDQEEQKRLHNTRVDKIISMAVDAGVTPLTKDGEELQLLDPRQLDEWVAAHLPSALLC